MRTLWVSLFVAVGIALGGCSSNSDDAPTVATKTIGPEGGTIEVAGATVTFPAGALVLEREITVSSGKANPPDGYIALSPVFRCEPSGIDFAQPVTMQMPFTDDGKGAATMFWSSGAQPAFKDLGGTVQGTTMIANVEHFSEGFIGRHE